MAVVIPFPRAHEPYWREAPAEEEVREMAPSDLFLWKATMAFCGLLFCLSGPILVLLVIGVFQ